MRFPTDKLCGRKKAKDRVIVLVCTNMDGSDKRPLLIIGKSSQPHCFRGVLTLPIPYTSSSNARMTSNIFHKWLKEKQDWHIALTLDNCSVHPKDCGDELANLPPNVTSVIQPWIICNLRNV